MIDIDKTPEPTDSYGRVIKGLQRERTWQEEH